MCGVYGIVRFGSDYLPSDSFYDFTRMVVATQDRGVDGTGFVGVQAWLDNPVAVEFRSPKKASEATMTKEWDLCKSDFLESPIIIGVNRAAPLPEGDSSKVKNQPPFVIEDVVLTHNGTFSNDRELFVANPDWKRQTEVDTEVVAHLWRKHADCRNLRTRIQEVCREIVGGFTAPIVDLDSPNKVIILHNFKPLAVVFNPDEGLLIYNSELKNIVEGWGSEILDPTSPWKIIEVGAFESLIIDREDLSIEKVETPHTTWSSLPTRDDSKAVVICSGGLDSCTAAMIAQQIHKKDVTLVHCNYGQIAKDREWEAVSRVADKLGMNKKQIDVSYIGDWCKTPLTSKDVELPLGILSMESTKVFVPARNQLFLTIAAAFCEANGIPYIYSGFNLEESGCYPDNTMNFFKKFNQSLDYGTLLRPKLALVLERFMKVEIIRLSDHISKQCLPEPLLTYSWSCDTDGYWHSEDNGGQGGWRACGICGCCSCRQMAFAKARLPDPQKYHEPLRDKPVWMEEGIWTDNSASIDELLERVKWRESMVV